MLVSSRPGSLGVVVFLAATVVACGGSPSGGGAGGGGATSGAGGAAGGPGGSAGASSSRGGADASGGSGGAAGNDGRGGTGTTGAGGSAAGGSAPCGSTTCTSGEICVKRFCPDAPPCYALPASGVCPSGTFHTTCGVSVKMDGCEAECPVPFCASRPAACGTTLTCSCIPQSLCSCNGTSGQVVTCT
jgi:hypothetical protein